MSLDEFSLINAYFKRNNLRSDVLLGIGDDCAVLKPPLAKCLLVSTDTLNIDRHFFPTTSPFDIGYKSAAVSLSDLAAMGGDPAWLLLALTLPEADPDWLEPFSNGLFTCLEAFGMTLVGGNVTQGPLAITTQIIGFASEGHYLSRKGASPGDLIYVTGTLGESGLALKLLKDQMSQPLFNKEERQALVRRLWQPTPRIAEGKMLIDIASAAIDISDGLAADIQHLLDKNNVGATIHVAKLPLSESIQRLPIHLRTNLMLTAGDDYELCFTVPPHQIERLEKRSRQCLGPFTCIGQIEQGSGLNILQQDGTPLHLNCQGYQHF